MQKFQFNEGGSDVKVSDDIVDFNAVDNNDANCNDKFEFNFMESINSDENDNNISNSSDLYYNYNLQSNNKFEINTAPNNENNNNNSNNEVGSSNGLEE